MYVLHNTRRRIQLASKYLLFFPMFLLGVTLSAANKGEMVPGFMDNFRKVISAPANLTDFFLNARIAENTSEAARRIPDSLKEAGFPVEEKTTGSDIRLGGKTVPLAGHIFWRHYEAPNQRPWLDIIEFEGENTCIEFYERKDQWHSGAPRQDSFLFFTVNNIDGLDAVSVILRRGRTIFNFGMAIPFKIKMPKEGENSPEERIYIGDSIDSLVSVMEAVAKAFVNPETKTWIPPAAPDEEEIRFMRLAAFARLWSEVKYNFVFLDKRPNLDWDRMLELYLPRVAAVKSQGEYVRILQEVIALLQDGHSRVNGGISDDAPQLNIEPVEGKPVVTAVGQTPEMQALPIRPGMELTAVNGVPVEQILKNEIYPYISASTIQDRNVKAFRRLLQGASGSALSATFSDMGGELYNVTLECNLSDNRNAAPWTRQPYPFRYRELQDGLAYVALNTFGTKRVVGSFDARFDDILESRALIIDIRNNSGGSTTQGYDIIARLIEKPCDKTSVWRTREYNPIFKAWGRDQKWHEGDHGTIDPRGEVPYLKPVAVLIGPKTYSAAEDFLVPLKATGRATLIGEATGGSTGQPLTMNIIGTRVRICVKWDRFPDGTEFVGKGIPPDIVVPITRDDIKEGRDPVLERAIEFLMARLGDMDH